MSPANNLPEFTLNSHIQFSIPLPHKHKTIIRSEQISRIIGQYVSVQGNPLIQSTIDMSDFGNHQKKIKMFMSKEFVGYFAKIISNMIEVRHDKLFVKT